MKPLIIVFFLMMSFQSAFSQLQIEEQSKAKITYSGNGLIDFIHQNHIDYALIGRQTFYGQIFGTENFCCLLQQNNNWYLAKISQTTARMQQTEIKITQRQLNTVELNAVKLSLGIDSAFKYTMADFKKLPNGCQYEKNGKMAGMSGVLDGSGFNLLQVSGKGVKLLFYSNPDVYLHVCYPYVKEFGILRGFVNTIDELYKLTENLQP